MAKKRIIIAVLIAAILIGGTGCMLKTIFKGPASDVNQLALSYMEEKYGEKFTYASPYGNSMSGTREFFVTCDSFPGQDILVQVENYKSDERIFRDNYLAVKYKEDTIEYIRNCAPGFSEINIFYDAPKNGQSENLSALTSFEDFLSDGRAEMNVMIELKSSEFSEITQANNIGYKIAGSGTNMTLTIVVVDEEIFGTLDRDGLNKRIALQNYVARAKMYIKNNQVTIDWRGEGIANG